MGQLSAQCPHCRAKMQLQKPELIGKTAKCPACKEAFVIKPVAEETAAPAAAPKKSAAAPDAAAPAKKKPAAAAAPTSKKAAASTTKSKSGAAASAQAKVKQDIDFEVDDDDEIFEAEVVEDDDDWLKTLDALSPSEMGKRSGRTSGAAPVVRGGPKKQATTTKKRKRRLRDPDGELPLWMSRSLSVVIGATVGAVAMLIWAGFVAKTGMPSRWMPVFIGATVGTGVRLGASKWDFGLFPAVTAALIALTAVIGGKVIGWNLMKHQALDRDRMIARYELRLAKHEDYKYSLMAEEIHRMYLQDGLKDAQSLYRDDFTTMTMTEPEIAEYYSPTKLQDVYGEARWKEAKTRWDSLSDEERKDYEADIQAEVENLTAVVNMDVGAEVKRGDELRAAVGQSGGALGILDFIMAAVAVVGAFKIAAGMADSAIDTSPGH
jgi:hypothetical protein